MGVRVAVELDIQEVLNDPQEALDDALERFQVACWHEIEEILAEVIVNDES